MKKQCSYNNLNMSFRLSSPSQKPVENNLDTLFCFYCLNNW
jgi:hypothetical protein